MKVDPSQCIGQIAVLHKEAIPVFEKYKIDYVTQGSRPLRDACFVSGKPLEEVWQELEKVESPKGEWYRLDPDWGGESTAALVDHILRVHHVYTRDQLDKIDRMLLEMLSMDSERSPKLSAIQRVFSQFSQETRDHMLQEEEVVFPYLVAVERAGKDGERLPNPFRGYNLLTHPLRILMSDHGLMGKEWQEIEELTDGFLLPPKAGRRLRELYGALQELEKDNRQHMHLENNVLFHRAIAMGLLDDDDKGKNPKPE